LHRARPLCKVLSARNECLINEDNLNGPGLTKLSTQHSSLSTVAVAEGGIQTTVPLLRRMLSKHVDSTTRTLQPIREAGL
jgi:hypothetical protein